MSRMKIAPLLTGLVFEYAKAFDRDMAGATWAEAAKELRALLAVARSVRKEHQFCPTFEKCPTCRALSRLDRLSSGTGKRKTRRSRSPEGTETPSQRGGEGEPTP